LEEVTESVQKLEGLVRLQMSQFELQKLLKAWAKQHSAEVRPMGRLVRSYKTEGENMHWHITGRQKGMGTVEVTYIPSIGRLTVLVHDNRRGLWAAQAYQDLFHEIEKRLSSANF
jgi:hypothetical protein